MFASGYQRAALAVSSLFVFVAEAGQIGGISRLFVGVEIACRQPMVVAAAEAAKMAQFPGSTVAITVFAPGNQLSPVTGIPWYPGITVLNAMIIGQAMMGPAAFNFRLVYHSAFGAFVDMIDDRVEGNGNFWMLTIDGVQANFGAAEQIIAEPSEGATSTVEWSLGPPPSEPASAQLQLRVAKASS